MKAARDVSFDHYSWLAANRMEAEYALHEGMPTRRQRKMPMRKLQALGPNHKWCEFPVFGLDNLELLSQLQSALAGTPTGGGANGRGNLLEEERRLKSTATSRRRRRETNNRNFV